MLQTYYLLFFPNESRSTPDKKKLVGFNFWSKQWVICIQPTIFKHSEAGYRILNTAASKRSKATNCRFSLSIYYQQSFFSAAIVVIHLLLDLFQLGYQDISWGLYLDVTDRSISSTYLIIWSSGPLSLHLLLYQASFKEFFLLCYFFALRTMKSLCWEWDLQHSL